jgi:hypothetical protein
MDLVAFRLESVKVTVFRERRILVRVVDDQSGSGVKAELRRVLPCDRHDRASEIAYIRIPGLGNRVEANQHLAGALIRIPYLIIVFCKPTGVILQLLKDLRYGSGARL